MIPIPKRRKTIACNVPYARPSPYNPKLHKQASCLTTETVEGAALALQGVDNVKRRDSLALGVLGVGDGITDDTLKEGLQDTTGLLVDHCDALVNRRGK